MAATGDAAKHLEAQDLLYSLQSREQLACLMSSSLEAPQQVLLQIFACAESLHSELRRGGYESNSTGKNESEKDLARSALEALFQVSCSDTASPVPCAEEQHCCWVLAALAGAAPLLTGVLPRHNTTCIIPHQHPLKKVIVDDSYARISTTGVRYYRTSRVCDNCDVTIDQKEYWHCGEPKASGGHCSVDFCMKCHEEMQAAFAACSMQDAMWVVRFVQNVASHLLVEMTPDVRQALVRQLAFELPLSIFKALVVVVVDVVDACVVNIEDNISDVSEFTDFWHTLGFLDLLYEANILPAKERRVGQVFIEGARLAKEYFVLQGLDKCEVCADWKRWQATMKPANHDPELTEVGADVIEAGSSDEPDRTESNVLTTQSFKVDTHFTCFLSHVSFIPRAFLHQAATLDVNALPSRLNWRRLEFRRDSEALRHDVISGLGFCFETGQTVRLRVPKVALDCKCDQGQLQSFDQQTGKWNVTMDDGGEMMIETASLEHVNEEDLKSTLPMLIDPRFAGENGRGPGVMKEFYHLALQSLVSCADFWEYNKEARVYWFSDSTSPEAIAGFRAMGVILGNAIRLALVLPAVFPEPLFSLLLRGLGASSVGQWSLADLRKVSPEFARSFECFIEYDQDDAAALFTLDWPRGDEVADLPRDQRGDYVQAYVEWFFGERFKIQVSAMCDGFGAITGHSKMLKHLVSVEQLGQILNGIEEPVDLAAIRGRAKEVGWSGLDEELYIEQFWSIVMSFSEDQQRKFVVFVSSSARAPMKGWSDFGLQVQKNGAGDERMPTAYTCFHLLLLPYYSSHDLLRARLLQAIEETQGFGLY
eukprot:TRINITY_DN35111_c0_g1_i1.p1 TRINITY_DN35111_c0_g1~~TRINITY_DN35111_c0_g1_i1.p1  ORF type:complete len:821 (-),score=120.58 TRINITY_DN35111_c0_g1_i1:5-2467(-)